MNKIKVTCLCGKQAKELTILEKLRHKNMMEELLFEKEAREGVENIKFNHIMSAHRLKRSDRQNEDARRGKYGS